MKLLHAIVENFGSYKNLTLNYQDKGLCLVEGPTGSGKSTLCDIVPWALFGKTAKGGAVDDIRRWSAKDPTIVNLTILINNEEVTIRRIRGSSKDNDLSFFRTGSLVRGKDLTDTQILINSLLGSDIDLYLSGAYFHEFSSTSSFFTTTAKIRRQITEQLVDLSLPKKLSENMTEYRKSLKKELENLNSALTSKRSHAEYIKKNLSSAQVNLSNWEIMREGKMERLQTDNKTFEVEKAVFIENLKTSHMKRRIELEYDIQQYEKDLVPDSYFIKAEASIQQRLTECKDDTCSACGAKKDSQVRLVIEKEKYALAAAKAKNEQIKINLVRFHQGLEHHNKSLENSLTKEKARKNTYLQQIKDLAAESNPYEVILDQATADKEETRVEIENLIKDVECVAIEYSDIELLLDLTGTLRASIVKSTILDLEKSTNKLLTKHFDAEIKVKFDISGADKIEVDIFKDGNTCSYSQLSKGQRQLLKLCFGVSVMYTIAKHHSVNFSSIFLDEVADGLDETMKAKAFGLFQELATKYDNVLVTEHSEYLKSLFPNQIHVTLVNGESQIEEA